MKGDTFKLPYSLTFAVFYEVIWKKPTYINISCVRDIMPTALHVSSSHK